MIYHSTRDLSLAATGAEAIVAGIAPDGGLYVPEVLPKIDRSAWRGASFQDMACGIFQLFFDELEDDLAGIVKAAYASFDDPAIAPVRVVNERLALLELWHGPTLAFKDVALQALPHLMQAALKALGRQEKVLILTATSGDTGKAAMAGFADVKDSGVIVYYPADGVSEAQRRQMLTHGEDNTIALGVEGNFDDCQAGVKRLFADRVLQETLAARGIRLSSANSINIGRLVPQITYYFTAYEALVRKGVLEDGQPLDLTVPTGNFGDFLAGVYAKEMGLPLGQMTVASNANHVLTDFGETGVYDANRPLVLTASPSMDILISSNLERYLFLRLGDAEKVRALMTELRETGRFALQKLDGVRWGWADETAVFATIRDLYESDRVTIDPHTAVAVDVARQVSDGFQLVLSTASAYKFPREVLTALGREVPETLEAQWEALQEASKLPVPQPIQKLRSARPRLEHRVAVDAMRESVLEFAKGVF